MITFTHTAGTTAANVPELLKLGHELCKYVKDKTGVVTKVQIPAGGNHGKSALPPSTRI